MAGLLTTFIVSGRLVSRTGSYKIFPIVGTAVTAIGLALLATLQPHTSYFSSRSSCSSWVSGSGS